jgi:DNA-binding IclR family transcriptional regulator
MSAGNQKLAGTQSIQRAASLLREIAAHNRAGLRLVDLVERLGLEQPTVHRMLKSLMAENLVLQETESRRYFLGHAVYEFGLAAAQRFNLRDLCQASLQRIAGQTGDTVFLTGRSGNEAVCLDRKDGEYPIKIFSFTPGERRPLGIGAGGRAILGALPAEEMQRVVTANASQLAEYEGLTAERVLELVRGDRERGYTLHDVSGGSEVKAIGVAIRNPAGEPVAALSVSGIASRIDGERRGQLVALLRDEARAVEKSLA